MTVRIILSALAVLFYASNADAKFRMKDLIGAWLYEEAYTVLADGRRVDEFGPRPRGIFIVMANGYYSHIVMDDNLPKVASGLLKETDPKDQERLAEGILAHYGQWSADEKAGTLTVSIIKSSFPNFDGAAQVRKILELTPTTLRYVNMLSSAGPGAQVVARLKRLP